MPRLRVNGVELYYEVIGEGDPLVLVHGGWGDHTSWRLVVDEFARSYQIVTYDRRGHSQSDRVSAPDVFRAHEEDLDALIEKLGIAPAHVVGNSIGGSIALRLGSRRPAAGKREGGPRLFFETIALGPGAWERLPEQSRRAYVTNAPTFLAEMRDPEQLRLDLEGLARFPHPTLLTNGDNSRPEFAAVVGRLARVMPRAERRTVVGAGHVPHVTHPTDYAQITLEFLSRLS